VAVAKAGAIQAAKKASWEGIDEEELRAAIVKGSHQRGCKGIFSILNSKLTILTSHF
jgi:hypothetical protein